MADTALTLITDALLDLGVLSADETPDAIQSSGGLRKLNQLIESWNIENLMVYGATPYVFPLTSGVGTYTLGPGGNFDISRPNKIMSAAVRDLSQTANSQLDYQLYIYNDAEYQSVSLKNMTQTLPMGIYFDYTYPLITVRVLPIPTTTQYSLVLWIDGMIPDTLTLATVISLAPGYKRALTANLAMELAASYGVQPAPTLVSVAMASKSGLKVQNTQINELRTGYDYNPYLAFITGYMQ